MIFTRDFVTRENHWQIASLVTQKSLYTITHALFFISHIFPGLYRLLPNGAKALRGLQSLKTTTPPAIIPSVLATRPWPVRVMIIYIYIFYVKYLGFIFLVSRCRFTQLECVFKTSPDILTVCVQAVLLIIHGIQRIPTHMRYFAGQRRSFASLSSRL